LIYLGAPGRTWAHLGAALIYLGAPGRCLDLPGRTWAHFVPIFWAICLFFEQKAVFLLLFAIKSAF